MYVYICMYVRMYVPVVNADFLPRKCGVLNSSHTSQGLHRYLHMHLCMYVCMYV